MVAAPGAGHRQPEEHGADDIGSLGEHIVATQGDLGISRVAADRAQPVEDRSRQTLVIIRRDLVPGDLLDDKTIEGLVAIE